MSEKQKSTHPECTLLLCRSCGLVFERTTVRLSKKCPRCKETNIVPYTKNMNDTCPECKLFVWACKCHLSPDQRIPTEKEIREFIPIFGDHLSDSFIAGFKAGWNAYKVNTDEFKIIFEKNKKEREEKNAKT
jgi:phage FluMu protein Com